MDCQLIMGAFVYFYHQTFIKSVATGAAAYILGLLGPKEQLDLYQALGDNLGRLGLIPQ
jgi:putative Mn2+ efflux pump MntP